jgi:trk system potassium uptake protein TrkA
MLQVSPHEGWVGHKLSEFEAATGSRVGLITRFGVGELPTVSTLIQAGDTIHVLTTDARTPLLRDVASTSPEGGH